MSRTTGFIIFFGIFLTILGGTHYYIWARLVRDTHLPAPWRHLATASIALLAVSLPAAFVVRRGFGNPTFKALNWTAYVWMGLMFFLFVTLLSGDLVRLGIFVWKKLSGAPPIDEERRKLLGRFFGAAVAAVSASFGALAMFEALKRVQVRDVKVPLAKLHKSAHGTTLVQLTDVHIGPTIGREFIADLVARVNALSADVVVITGDLVDGSVSQLREAVAPLGQIKARHGVYFVTGNHEYYAGAEQWITELGRLGIRVLRNERVTIGSGEAAFDLAGVDDYSARGQAPGHGPDLRAALADRDETRALVLLAHQPRAVWEASEHGVCLQLSGHTHGGQIWPFYYLVKLQQPFIRGLHKVGDTLLYVSCGTGYWGPPMRFRAPAEVTRIVLEAAA